MGYENWSSKRAYTKKQPQEAADKDSTKSATSNKAFVVAPYVQGVSEKIRRVFSSYGVFICFKPHQTLRQILVAPKDRTKVEDQLFTTFHVGAATKFTLVKPRDQLESVLKNTLQKLLSLLVSTKNYNQSLTKIVEETFQRSIVVS